MIERIATLQEIETHWSWLDLEKANEALDIRDDIDAAAHEIAEARRQNP